MASDRFAYRQFISSETHYYAACSACDNVMGDDEPITDERQIHKDLKFYGWVVIDGSLYCDNCRHEKEGEDEDDVEVPRG